jgi:hypothetical protein
LWVRKLVRIRQTPQAKEGLLFVNKKKRKNFVNLGHGRWRRQSPWPSTTKIFAPLFLKAAASFLRYHPQLLKIFLASNISDRLF